MAYENLTWLTGKPRISRPVEALAWADPDLGQVPLTEASPAADTDDFFRNTGDVRVTTDPALIGDRRRHEAKQEKVAIDLTALVCRAPEGPDFAGDDGHLVGLYLHLTRAEVQTPTIV
jgi:hypothetical protein